MELEVSLLELAMCVSDTADLIDHAVADHHRKVAYIGFRIGLEMGLPRDEVDQLVLAGAVHDVGALSLRERLAALEFDVIETAHEEPGYLLLREFGPFESVAEVVRVHHTDWVDRDAVAASGRSVPDLAHVVYLADRVSVLLSSSAEPFSQRDHVLEAVRDARGRKFMPEADDAFQRLAADDGFWFDLSSMETSPYPFSGTGLPSARLTHTDVEDFARMLARIVDFRSAFTATHSAGVAATARVLGRLAGMTPNECDVLWSAGHLHDLGKLAVPSELVEKRGGLTEREWGVMRSHSYLTHKVLSTLKGLEPLARWASNHHERLDGSGYPFHLRDGEIDTGSRVMAVADVFTALAEDRPYRAGLGRAQSMLRMTQLGDGASLDAEIVHALVDGFDEVDEVRCAAQSECREEFDDFSRRLTVAA